MSKIKPRVSEGGVIEDNSEIKMEQYSEIMKKQLGREYIRFADVAEDMKDISAR